MCPSRSRGFVFKSLPWAALAICLAVGPQARGATRTWDGGDGSAAFWTNVLNWDGDLSAPVGGDSLIFSGGTGLENTNNIVGLSLNSIGFVSQNFTLRGNAITINNGILDRAGFNTNNLIVTLGAAQGFSNAVSGAALALNGNITNGTHQLTVGGDGDVLIGGIIGSGTGGITKEGAGVLRLGAANTFAGGLSVNGGTVQFRNAAGIPSGAGRGDVALATGTTLDLAAKLDCQCHLSAVHGHGRPSVGQPDRDRFAASARWRGDRIFAGSL